jgi:AcrR family transcriptional regulator
VGATYCVVDTLTRATHYWYFKSKDDIIIAILDAVFAREMAGVCSLPEATGPVRERLLQFVGLIVAEIKGMKVLLPILYAFYALTFCNKTVRTALRHYLDAYIAALV